MMPPEDPLPLLKNELQHMANPSLLLSGLVLTALHLLNQNQFGIGSFMLNISPREAAFPPTFGRLSIFISLNHRMNSLSFFIIIINYHLFLSLSDFFLNEFYI